jgi:hypothetical protein
VAGLMLNPLEWLLPDSTVSFSASAVELDGAEGGMECSGSIRGCSAILEPAERLVPCRVWPLEEMAAAHEYCEKGHVRGKVGILIKEM